MCRPSRVTGMRNGLIQRWKKMPSSHSTSWGGGLDRRDPGARMLTSRVCRPGVAPAMQKARWASTSARMRGPSPAGGGASGIGMSTRSITPRKVRSSPAPSSVSRQNRAYLRYTPLGSVAVVNGRLRLAGRRAPAGGRVVNADFSAARIQRQNRPAPPLPLPLPGHTGLCHTRDAGLRLPPAAPSLSGGVK